MAYDGIFIKAQLAEIKDSILNERITKITEPSEKEVLLYIRKHGEDLICKFSVDPNFPYILLTKDNKENNNVPPAFCMILRKYLNGGLIKKIEQIGSDFEENNRIEHFERIVDVIVENIDEFGDKKDFHLIIEIMGKYSNIILLDDKYFILDVLIKYKDENARLKQKAKYSLNDVANKKEFLEENVNSYIEKINNEKAISEINKESFDLASMISKNYAGVSRQVISDICHKYNETDEDYYKNVYNDFSGLLKLVIKFSNKNNSNNKVSARKKTINQENYHTECLDNRIIRDINKNIYKPVIHYKGEKVSDFYFYKLNSFEGDVIEFDYLNDCLNTYIHAKYVHTDDSTEKKNIEAIIKNLYVKLNKKLDIYESDLEKAKDAEKYKKYGDLVSAFGFNKELIKDGVLTCEDYNDNNKKISIKLDTDMDIASNVKKFYDRYNKLKRTKDNALELIEETKDKIEHLDSIKASLTLSNNKNDIFLIKKELSDYFDEMAKYKEISDFSKKINSSKNKKNQKTNYNIHHYKSSAGIDIFVGKNNLENEYLTFTLADSNDTWFHIKGLPGAHVIVKKPYDFMDEKTLKEAASMAAYFSEMKNEAKATVDYTLRKELKKVKGKVPGFCIYHKNFSINVKPELILKEI